MAANDPAIRVRADERIEGDPTPGMIREQAIAVDGVWAGLVRTDAGMTSGWHHHGNHDTAIYVVAGGLRLECGPGGETVVEAQAGDFVHVPKGAIHREGNPADVEAQLVVVRAGDGPVVVNVEGPADPA